MEQLSRLLQRSEAVRFGEPVSDLRQAPTPDEGEAGLLIPAMAAPLGITRLPERQ